MPGLLQNHIAVITGAGSGIGRAIALGYAREGATVATLDINGEPAAETAKAIRDAGSKAQAFTLDVSDRAACRTVAAEVAKQLGKVSILATNLDGVFNVTQAFTAPLRASKGRIINIGSIQSLMHVRTPSSAAYTASKHGVLGFTRALAAELGKDGVRVNAIGPGFIETPFNAKMRAENPERVKIFVEHTPLGRPGTPDDIVGPAIFLASDLSVFVTGSIILADGGYRTV
jgi:3-oxoacyl-[acyl-carrier protein] reductase